MPWNTDDIKQDDGKRTFRVFFTRTSDRFIDIEAEHEDEAEDLFYEGDYAKEDVVKVPGSNKKQILYMKDLSADSCEDDCGCDTDED